MIPSQLAPRGKALGAGLAMALLVCGLGLRFCGAFEAAYLESGPRILAYNLLRLGLAGLVLASCHNLGGLCFGLHALPMLERFICRTFLGLAAFSLLGFGLGMLGLLYFPAAVLCLGLPLLYFPLRFESVRFKLGDLNLKNLYAGLVPLFFILLLGAAYPLKSLPYAFQGLDTNDFGHYLPFYRSVIERGDLWPNTYFMAYFYTKGSGFQQLLAALSDVSGPALGTYLALGLSFVALYSLVFRLSRGSRLLSLAALVYFAYSPFFTAETYKAHITLGALVCFILYLLCLKDLSLKPEARAIDRGLGLSIVAVTVLSPPVQGFLLPVLGLNLALIWLTRREERKSALLLALCGPLCAGLMLLLNYFSTGLYEFSPQLFFIKRLNKDILSSWLSPCAMYLVQVFDRGEGFFALPKFGWREALLPLCLTLGALAAWFGLKSGGLGRIRRFFRTLWPLAAMSLCVLVVSRLAVHASIVRFSVFVNFCWAGLGAGFAWLCFSLLRSWLGKRAGALAAGLAGGCGVICLCGAAFFWLGLNIKALERSGAFMLGQTPAVSLFSGWNEPVLTALDSTLEPGEPVMPLNFQHGAYVMPSGRFWRPLENPMARQTSQFVFGTSEQAREVLYAHKLRRFVINTSFEPLFPVFSELFHPDFLAEHFRVKPLGERIWLLTLDGTELDGKVPDENFKREYRDCLRLGQSDILGRIMLKGMETARGPCLGQPFNP